MDQDQRAKLVDLMEAIPARVELLLEATAQLHEQTIQLATLVKGIDGLTKAETEEGGNDG